MYSSQSSDETKSTVTEEIRNELPALKKMVEKSNTFFKNNYDRFNKFRKFVYQTTITEPEKRVNDTLGRPNIDANVIAAYNSRLCGEFSKQEPSVEVSKDEGANIPSQVIEVVEGHIRHIFDEAKKSNTQYNTYRDSITGGFCGLKVMTDYANEMSFSQVIKLSKTKYPTLTGYDPMANDQTKSDGNYCFDLYPKNKEDFKIEYPHLDVNVIRFNSADELGGFSWAYNNGVDDIILICCLFKKKKQKVKIMQLSDGQTLTEKEYKKFIKEWKESGTLAVPPTVVGKPRNTTITTICKYTFFDKDVIDYEETDFKYLPNVFVDGDSIDLFDNIKGTVTQITRPYAINAMGAQQLKNLGVQCLAQYIENIVQHKFIVKKEAIPQEKEYLNALTQTQIANTIVVNAYMDDDPNKPIPEPIIPISPAPAPPEITNAITLADTIIQNELGSYDAQLGINDNQLSGVAIVEAATQSNASAMPFVVNYVSALNQAANIIIDLIPKYYKTPMTVPIIDKEGKRSAVKIQINEKGMPVIQSTNEMGMPQEIDFNYDSNMLKVKVTAGVNFAIAKNRAMQQIIALSQASKGFAMFMESKGLKVLLDNLEIRGSDILKELANEYQKEQEQMRQQQMQMQQSAMMNDPRMMEQKTKAMTAQADMVLKEKEMQLKEQEFAVKLEKTKADLEASLARAHAEEYRANADLKLAHLDMQHRHGKESIETLHKISKNERGIRHEKE